MPRSLEQRSASAWSTLAYVDGHELRDLAKGWQAARTAPDAHVDASSIDALSWSPARVPGTAAGVLHDAGMLQAGESHDFDAEDWWFRTNFDAQPLLPGEDVRLCLDGIATVAEVYLNGELMLESDSMFAAHTLDVAERLKTSNELAIRCRALAPLLRVRRRPRARWRTSLVAEGNLRFFRTMLLGRLPGIAPGPAAVGPWRAVRLERHRRIDVRKLTLRTHLDGADGVLSVQAQLHPLDGEEVNSVEIQLSGPSGSHRAELALTTTHAEASVLTVTGDLLVRGVEQWWPHTHGDPVLHHTSLRVDTTGGEIAIDAGRVGFRDLAFGASPQHDVERDGLDLRVNGVPVFVRGAVWTPIEPVGLAPSEEELRAELTRVRDAGMNMLRLPGTGAYETGTFHDLCDELGILLWQDFMFANLDYPIADEHFRASVASEISHVLAALGARPSLAVLCGNSEVEQQVAMMGLDPALGRGELFGELIPQLVRESRVDAAYVPTAPCGGELPFRVDRGIGTYYGVGCYRLPLEDARRAEVRFAAECLAFSHVPAEATIEAMLPQAPGRLAGHNPLWKAGVPRENEADWDFEDIRDHYLRLLYGVDAPELRRVDHARYLELSRALTGEILAEVFGEWRRDASPCHGGLILWLHDLLPGAGWGLVDHRGTPKLAYHHLKRALAPVAVWTVDEQLGGVVAHVANDRPMPLVASLRVALYREREHRVEQARAPVELRAHSQGEWNLETVIGHFLDAAWSYRFGPPGHDTIVVTLEEEENENAPILSQAMHFPAGRPLEREPPQRLGLTAQAQTLPNGQVRLTLSCVRLVYGVEIHTPGFLASDDGFSIEPGTARVVTLRPTGTEGSPQDGRIGAINMNGRIKIAGVSAAAPSEGS
jgi:beta-mannosidase